MFQRTSASNHQSPLWSLCPQRLQTYSLSAQTSDLQLCTIPGWPSHMPNPARWPGVCKHHGPKRRPDCVVPAPNHSSTQPGGVSKHSAQELSYILSTRPSTSTTAAQQKQSKASKGTGGRRMVEEHGAGPSPAKGDSQLLAQSLCLDVWFHTLPHTGRVSACVWSPQ